VKAKLTGDKEADAKIRQTAQNLVKDYVKTQRKTMKKLRKSFQGLIKKQKDRESDAAANDETMTHEQEEEAAATKATEDGVILGAKTEYYQQKSKFEQANNMFSKQGAAQRKAQEAVDAVKFTQDISDKKKEEIQGTVKKFLNYVTDKETSEEAKQKALERGWKLLQKFEEDAEFEVSVSKRRMKKKPTDKNKAKYYTAKNVYEFIGKIAGDDSPAKKAEKKRVAEAAEAKAKADVIEALSRARNARDVAKAIKEATKGNSVVADTLMESKTNKGMKEVLKMAAKDPSVAEMLAKALLAAKTEDDVADAFSNVKLEVLEK